MFALLWSPAGAPIAAVPGPVGAPTNATPGGLPCSYLAVALCSRSFGPLPLWLAVRTKLPSRSMFAVLRSASLLARSAHQTSESLYVRAGLGPRHRRSVLTQGRPPEPPTAADAPSRQLSERLHQLGRTRWLEPGQGRACSEVLRGPGRGSNLASALFAEKDRRSAGPLKKPDAKPLDWAAAPLAHRALAGPAEPWQARAFRDGPVPVVIRFC